MVKQGGTSYNTNSSKKGIRINKVIKCQYCGRYFKQEWTKDRHEKNCKEYNHK